MMNNPPSPRHGPVAFRGASDSAAALQGANLAFIKGSKPKPTPPANNLGSRNSALTAATTSASRDRSRSRSPVPPLNRHTTGGSSRGLTEHSRYGGDSASDSLGSREQTLRSGGGPSASAATAVGFLQPSSATSARSNMFDPKTTSFIAATLAASRSASPSPQTKGSLLGGQASASTAHAPSTSRSRRSASIESASMSNRDLPDTSSIAPTNSLISMFEGPHDRNDGDMDPVKKGHQAPQQKNPSKKPREKPPLRPMTPERSVSPKTEPVPSTLPAVVSDEVDSLPPRRKDTKAKPNPKPKVRSQQNSGLAQLSASAMPPTRAARATQQSQSNEERATDSPSQSSQWSGQPKEALAAVPSQARAAEVPGPGPGMRLRQPPGTSQVLGGSSPRMPRPTPPPKSEKLLAENAQQPQSVVAHSSTSAPVSPKPRPLSQPKPRPPTPPQPRGSAVASRSTSRHPEAAKPTRAPKSPVQPLRDPERSSPDNRPTTASTTSSNDTFVSASSTQTPVPRSPPRRRASTPRLPSPSGINANRGSPTRTPAPPLPRRTPTSASSSSLPLHSLSNAIMAGSLAAARLTPSNTGTSSVSLGPTPTLSRHGKSPRLRQTLRQPVSVSDDETEARRIKKHHGHHTHSNKKHFHHEGSRKRWREEIKPNERKRYEALWASNRGLLAERLLPITTSSTDTVHLAAKKDITLNNKLHAYSLAGLGHADVSECVLNVVVREIWRRSRLPDDELAEVWELVASGRNMLDKQQFVVGMWIIDQRLRGRKIPTKASASVWDSAKGVRVSSPKSRKDGTKMRK